MKKLTLIFLMLFALLTLASCGECKHDFADGSCTKAAVCTKCGATDGEAPGHIMGEDDGDCSTPVRCQNCRKVMKVGLMAHVEGADDGVCTTPITCANCSVVVTVTHKAKFDDGNCMTADTCGACGELVAEAKAAHTFQSVEGSNAQTCVDCGTYKLEGFMNNEIKFGKAVVLGDSYSTFEGVIPDNYGQCYGPHGRHGLTSADQRWWMLLLNETGDELVFNSSYSGSAIAHITYDGVHNQNASFTARYLKDLDKRDFDTIFILGGTNDSWAGSPIGETKFGGTYTDEDLDSTVTAFCYLLDCIRKSHPDARIVNIVNNAYLKPDMCKGMDLACAHYGADNIYLYGFSQDANHPDVKGMVQLKDKILNYYKK
jgi:hypothetical protein